MYAAPVCDAGGHALQSETLVGSVWLLVVLFIAFNGFFFFDIAPRYHS